MYVYALGDPRTQQIRYVGIARDVYKRYAQHLNYPHANDAKNTWMTEIKRAGIVPTLAILESDVDENDIYEREKHWIRHYQDHGASLTNIKHGTTSQQIEVIVNASLPDKETYAIEELFEQLTIPIAELARRCTMHEVTLARIRKGQVHRRDIVNRMLIAFSQIYGRDLSIANVTGINIMFDKKLAGKTINV
jgi:hypothetical protein